MLSPVAAAEPLEVVIVGLLVLIVAGLAAIGIAIRRNASAAIGAGARSEEHVVRSHVRAAAPASAEPSPGGAAAKMVCPSCSSEFHGMTYCTRDARRLVPPAAIFGGLSMAIAARPLSNRAAEPTGVIARICPLCASKYDLNARFCGRDGGELIVIN